MEKRIHLMIAAGGSGGHLFPAQALALDLLQKNPEMQIAFVGAGLKTNHYFKKDLFPFLEIKSGTPFKKHPWHIFKALFSIGQGAFRCLKVFSKRKPDLIIGFGSYHTFPALFAAKLRKVPIILFESNVLPGKVNRFCSKWSALSAIQFSHAARYLKGSSTCVQMPLLKKKGEGPTKKEARDYFGLDQEKFTFLVFGGSQGAQGINRFFCGAAEHLVKKGIDFQVIHIVGEDKRAEKLRDFYEKVGANAVVKAFEEKMEYGWVAADVSVSRAGAATLAEMIEFGVPSILIPYPHGTENHQMKNALFVSEEIGGAVALEEKGLRGSILAAAICDLLENDKLKGMTQALHTFKEGESKQDLCSLVLGML
ncbi:UDP-N-acetylglucosamine--N-acetylmuramyl-(pentapeptide) pyrophosphoryl-undecaprenol N-acetylglucosamine transferase [Candidatus Neptunochlamydia vexilliferae]|uniref:UDP-N-acetylglucosamine--N-acetylmuramyl-(pentapeptide) pyrophosphoryl-undecaprenol N-acetylglucosamine transferase n=1 Tax=Candidatus Neptunichlamydia vexilliferae TaxID=1651774 RepID=A0ABS0AYH3_9BACT|nr:UDP-N-acetylglucosamine--N-acetylmuramyl-(pentapeptide) pyrophosphoryl-undecaprenol N-acetylglucosamine transferase [Candidatus Neptunochlamydia vexilliferae]MBF5059192.1 UDP-N-acetylglucosamine--N-acetylmuramyl- (pentapeptide) pyrophosphoryl-undecaprenol N-acetylglucosamine transferase [Candidatus Neptunochlamydia vexilliferae]